LIFYLDKTF